MLGWCRVFAFWCSGELRSEAGLIISLFAPATGGGGGEATDCGGGVVVGMAPKVSLCCVRCERSDDAGDNSVALELGELGGKDETCSESPKRVFGVSGKGGVAGWVLGVLGGL